MRRLWCYKGLVKSIGKKVNLSLCLTKSHAMKPYQTPVKAVLTQICIRYSVFHLSARALGITVFVDASRRTAGPSQPPLQWVSSQGVQPPKREAAHSLPLFLWTRWSRRYGVVLYHVLSWRVIYNCPSAYWYPGYARFPFNGFCSHKLFIYYIIFS